MKTAQLVTSPKSKALGVIFFSFLSFSLVLLLFGAQVRGDTVYTDFTEEEPLDMWTMLIPEDLQWGIEANKLRVDSSETVTEREESDILVWDKVGEIGSVDVESRVYADSFSSNNTMKFYKADSDYTGNMFFLEGGSYMFYNSLYNDEEPQTVFYEDGVEGDYETADYVDVKMRFRKEHTCIKAWAEGAEEPYSWDCEDIDPEYIIGPSIFGVQAQFDEPGYLAVDSVGMSGETNLYSDTKFVYSIEEGVLAVDIVDEAGDTVPSPKVGFPSQTFSSDSYDVSTSLGTNSEILRAYNPTSSETFNVSFQPDLSYYEGGDFGNVEWKDSEANNSYPIHSENDQDGKLYVDPSEEVASLSSDVDCSLEDVSLGTSSSFHLDIVNSENNVESIDLITSNGPASMFCRYDLKYVDLIQHVPASQEVGEYNLYMLLTIVE